MALRDQPYIPLYVQDYLTDEKLNLCSPSTQGVYIKIMCVFHKSEKYGGILLKQKDKQNKNICLDFALKLAKLLPFQLDIIIEALNELIDENVLSIDGDFLYQRRMVKDNNISIKRSESGKKGGEKTLGKDKNLLKQKTKQNPEDEDEDENINININNTLKKKEEVITWRNNFDIYLESLREARRRIISDTEWVQQKERYHPNVDIILSIEKACVEYWSKEAGWKKKKSDKKTIDIDWKSTFTNALNLKSNLVYKK
jgi:hypothetical protein